MCTTGTSSIATVDPMKSTTESCPDQVQLWSSIVKLGSHRDGTSTVLKTTSALLLAKSTTASSYPVSPDSHVPRPVAGMIGRPDVNSGYQWTCCKSRLTLAQQTGCCNMNPPTARVVNREAENCAHQAELLLSVVKCGCQRSTIAAVLKTTSSASSLATSRSSTRVQS